MVTRHEFLEFTETHEHEIVEDLDILIDHFDKIDSERWSELKECPSYIDKKFWECTHATGI